LPSQRLMRRRSTERSQFQSLNPYSNRFEHASPKNSFGQRLNRNINVR
jgi:hypothetical protein